MKDIRKSFLEEYGIYEYLIFLLGVIIASGATYKMLTLDTKDTTWLELGFITTIFFIGILAFSAPKYLVDIAKKKISKK